MGKHLSKDVIKQYRNYYINGLIDVETTMNELNITASAASNMLNNISHKDSDYEKLVKDITAGHKIPFSFPPKPEYVNIIRKILSNYNVPTPIRQECFKNNICQITYETQIAMFINKCKESDTKALFVIETTIDKETGYLIPQGKYKTELWLEENKQYYTKFIYNKDDVVIAKKIKDYNDYWITCDGEVISIRRGSLLKKTISVNGYYTVTLSKNTISKTFLISRLVAEAFIPNPYNKPAVNHIDGNKINNYYTNLEWVTNQENIDHAWKLGLINKNHIKKGEKNSNAKLNNEQVNNLRKDYDNNNIKVKELSKKYKISDTVVVNILTNKSYYDKNYIPTYIKKIGICKGENSNNAKLTNQEVLKIKHEYHVNKQSAIKLSKQYNVSKQTIYNVLKGLTYKEH